MNLLQRKKKKRTKTRPMLRSVYNTYYVQWSAYTAQFMTAGMTRRFVIVVKYNTLRIIERNIGQAGATSWRIQVLEQA